MVMTGTTFKDVVTSVAQLREIVAEPREAAVKKDIGVLDGHCRNLTHIRPSCSSQRRLPTARATSRQRGTRPDSSKWSTTTRS